MKTSSCPHKKNSRTSQHDHSSCIEKALRKAEAICRQRGARLTPQRRRVLELVWQTHEPVGAYDILAELQKEMRAAPPTVYRALDFLQQQGLIHRLASLNAYVGCATPDRADKVAYLICRCCKETSPLAPQNLSSEIAAQAERKGFRIENQIVEVLGLCPTCQQEGAADE